MPVPAEGNAVESVEEAQAVLALVRQHLRLLWTIAEDAAARALTEADIIVVSPYNAQVSLVAATLSAAGLGPSASAR